MSFKLLVLNAQLEDVHMLRLGQRYSESEEM